MPTRKKSKKHPKVVAPKVSVESGMTQHQMEHLKEVQQELKDRQVEALKLYRPNANQAEVHETKASEVLVIGGNRSGKSLCTFVEDARAVTGQDPHKKYPEKDGILVIVGKDWKHIGLVAVPYLFSDGAFKIIKDEKTGEWRAFNPETDEDRRDEAKPAPALIPKRMIKSTSWLLRSANYMQKCTLHNGWEIHFFSSEGEPVQGFNCNRVHIDEDISDERLHVGVRQPVEHVPSVAPARDEVLLQKDPQAL